jgi:predicted Co/Zn/Cd cation transporter (cation efflux family)
MERSAATAGIVVGLLVVVLSIILDWGWAATAIALTIFVVLGLVAMALGRRGGAAR